MSDNTKKYSSQSRNRRISLIVTYTILIVMAVIWLIPLVWIFISAFRCEYQPDGTFIGRVTSNFFPRQIGFENFRLLFTEKYYGIDHAFIRWVVNTLIVSVVDCIISTFLVLSVAYCIAKLKFKLRKAICFLIPYLSLFSF